MRFWCSADGTNWSWAWRPYVGAWLVVGLITGALWRAGTFAKEVPFRRKAAAALGLVLLLGATDWPLARLGAGYLVSAQMIRQVMIVMIAAPLLLFGAPDSLGHWLEATERRRKIVKILSTPVLSIIAAVVILFFVSVPVVVDPMIKTQYGAFLLDIMWISAGFLVWFPVQPPRPMKPRVSGPAVTVYLIAVSVLPLPVAFFMTWSEFPIYSVFELAPRVFANLDAKADQELAAAIFQVAGGLIVWMQIVVRFVRLAGGTSAASAQKYRGTLVSSDGQ